MAISRMHWLNLWFTAFWSGLAVFFWSEALPCGLPFILGAYCFSFSRSTSFHLDALLFFAGFHFNILPIFCVGLVVGLLGLSNRVITVAGTRRVEGIALAAATFQVRGNAVCLNPLPQREAGE